MRSLLHLALAAACLWLPAAALAPKVLIMTFFQDEGQVYLRNSNTTAAGGLDFRARTHRVPLADPQFPDLHCTGDGAVCVFTTGEAQVRAAASTMALLADPALDLSRTYWLLTGIAGGAPEAVTLNSIALARFTVQVTLQHEVDARERPAGFAGGYFPQGTTDPAAAWGAVYNSEVFEVSTGLRAAAAGMLAGVEPVDTPEAQEYRAHWAGVEGAAPASQPPAVVMCDVATSDVFYTGAELGKTFAERTRLWTNGTGRYCATAQEDGAVAGALLRGALEGRVDFERIAIVRTISDFERPYPGQSVLDNLVNVTLAYESAVNNVYLAGRTIATGIVDGWETKFAKGVPAGNYVGDVWGTLGNGPADFGPGRVDGGKPVDVPGAVDQRVKAVVSRRERVFGRRGGI